MLSEVDKQPEDTVNMTSTLNRAGRPLRNAAARFKTGQRAGDKLNFHISVRKGINTYGKLAVQSMKEEIESIFKKEAMHPVMLANLSKTAQENNEKLHVFKREI